MNVPKLGFSTAIELSRTEQNHYRALICTLSGFLEKEDRAKFRAKFLSETQKDLADLLDWIIKLNGGGANATKSKKAKTRG